MIRILIFELLQLVVSTFAIRWGGMPERLVGWMLLAAAAITLASGMPANSFRGVGVALVVIDVALFLGLLVIALRANRFWPYWIVALQLIEIAVHGARAVDPYLVPIVYSRVVHEIAYPMLFVLALGTYHYVRRARRDGTAPRPWATLRW